MATPTAERQAAKDLRLKLDLERTVEVELRRVDTAVARHFIRQPVGTGDFHAEKVEPVLRKQYARVQRAFEDVVNDQLPDDVKMTAEERAAVAASLTLEFDQRAQDQAKVIGDTTAREARRAAEIAREEASRMRGDGEEVGVRGEAVIAGAILKRQLSGRTRTIARVETQTSAEASKGKQALALIDLTQVLQSVVSPSSRPVETRSEDVTVTKEWVSQGDSVVRGAHLDSDSQVVLYNQPFIVMDQRLMYPGDTSLGATAANIANCRCASIVNTDQITEARRQRALNEVDQETRQPVRAPQPKPQGPPAAEPGQPDMTAKTSDRKWIGADGKYLPERAALHESILDDFTEGAVVKKDKTLQLMGGGPASGKGTAIRTGQVDLPTNAVAIDADEVKGKLPEFQIGAKAKDPNAAAFVHEESSTISGKLLTRSREEGFDTILDGTGDGSIEKLKSKVQPFRDAGYHVKADYVTVPTDVAVDRAFKRGQRSGRFVPESITREIHAGVSKTFPAAVKANLFDEVRLFDTDVPIGGTPTLIFSKVKGVETIHDTTRWEAFLAKADEAIPPASPVARAPTRAKPAPDPVPDMTAKTSDKKWAAPNGDFLPERAALHESILDDFTEGAVVKPEKTLQLMGGGPASGKGTAIKTGQVDLPTNAVAIDADEVKGKLPEFQVAAKAKDPNGAAFVHEESSIISGKLLTRSREEGFDTILDGTGDGGLEKLTSKVQPFRDAGYRVKADYVTVPTDVAVERAFKRGERSGRFVPESITREIHAGVSKVFPQAVNANLFDEVRLFDTDVAIGGTPDLIFSKIDGVETIHDADKWATFLAKGDEVF